MKSIKKTIVVNLMIMFFSSGIVFAAQGAGGNWGILKKMKNRSEIINTLKDIKECVAGKGIEVGSDIFEVKAAMEECMAEAGIDMHAKLDEFQTKIADGMAEHVVEDLSKHVIMETVFTKQMELADTVETCMEATGVIDLDNFDPATFDPVAVRKALGVCLREAGIEIDQEIVAKIEEFEAMIPDHVVDQMGEEIAEIIEHIQIIQNVEACVEATGVIDMENFDPQNIDFDAVKTAVNDCLGQTGIDITAVIKAKMDEIEALIEEHMAMAETVNTCMDASGIIDPKNFDPATFDMDAFKETLAGCLEEAGIDIRAIIAELEARHPELVAINECIDAIDFQSGDPKTIKDQIEACLALE